MTDSNLTHKAVWTLARCLVGKRRPATASCVSFSLASRILCAANADVFVWFAAFSVAFLLLTRPAHADLVLDLTGTPGSAVVSFAVGGSITRAVGSLNVPSAASAGTLVPIGDVWSSAIETVGDHIQPGVNTVISLSTAVTYLKNGSPSVSRNQITLIDNGAADTISIGKANSATYSALVPGDVWSWSGMGTFTLSGGATFDTVFNTGTTTTAIDGGNYVLNVSVPEPSSFLFLGLICTGLVGTWSWKKWCNIAV